MSPGAPRIWIGGGLLLGGGGLLAFAGLVESGITGYYVTPDVFGAIVNLASALALLLLGNHLLVTANPRRGTLVAFIVLVSAALSARLLFGHAGTGAVQAGLGCCAVGSVLFAPELEDWLGGLLERITTTTRRVVGLAPERTGPVSAATPSQRSTHLGLRVLSIFGALAAIVALADLAVRSAVRLDIHWDFFWYHLPFAAAFGGLGIAFDLSDTVRQQFEAFPSLAEHVQGILWRITGSVNATGVVNYLAFVLFIGYSHRVLRAPFWIVTLIALSAPLVLIHATVSYVDLFGNAFLAIGVSSCLYFYLFPERPSRAVLIVGLAGLGAAAWTKYNLVPVVAVVFILFALVAIRARPDTQGHGRSPMDARGRRVRNFGRRRAFMLVVIFAAVAAAPYARNLAEFGNPFWPLRVPLVGDLFPSQVDPTSEGIAQWRPASLRDAPQARVFAESLFETLNPTSYPNRPRWNIHMGNTSTAFLMGGFWGLGVVIFLALSFGLLSGLRRRAGVISSVVGVGLLSLVAVLPQSNELRYFMFIPLTWAATIGMLFPMLRERAPRAGLGLAVIVLAAFGYMVSENFVHYRVESITYRDAASAWGAANWWPRFQAGETYCAVNMVPIGIMMTGPTMHEFSIVDRSEESLCPPGSVVVTSTGIQGLHEP